MGERSTDEGALSAPYMSEITGDFLPVVTIPETYHHLMFDEPLATAATIKSFLLDWRREDGARQMQSLLADLN